MTPRTSWSWTPEIIQACSLMWANGKSYIEIAQEFGINRNMVAGIARRNRELFPRAASEDDSLIKKLNVKKRNEKKRKAVTVKEEKKLHSTFHGTKQAEYIDPALDDFEIGRLPGLSLLDNEGCYYPLTSGPENHMFCSHTRMMGKRYCEYHVEKTKGYQGIAFGYRERYDRNIVKVVD